MAAVPRQLVIWCPHWPVVASGVALGTPAAVLRDHRVIAVSRSAAVEGVHPGVRRREAQARCPEIVLVDEDPARDARRFEPIVRALADLVPVVEVAEPGTIVFATRGPSRWCGGDAALAERTLALVTAALGDLAGLVDGVGVGVADGRFAAAVAARRSARRGAPVLFEPGRTATAAALATVGVRALSELAGVPLEVVDLFERLGVRCLADLRALPAPDVLARFGPDGAFAHQLAGGGDDRPPSAVAPPPELAVDQPFDDPVVQLGPLVFSARQLAETLHGRLADRGETCTRLLVEAETEHGERSERRWHRGAGLSVAAMVERIRWQLEGWVDSPGGITGGVVLLRLVPEEARADQGRQLGFWGEATQADEWAARAITRVAGLLGPDAVSVAEWQGGRHPSDRYRWVSAAGADMADPEARRQALQPPTVSSRSGSSRSGSGSGPWPGSLGAPAPAWVAVEARPLEVLDAAGHPVRVDGRGDISSAPATVAWDAGRAHPVVAWAGPWPTDERWWDPARRRRRARFQLLTPDGEAVLACVEQGAWWLEGRYL